MKLIYALASAQSVHDYKYQRIKQKVTRKCSAHRQRLARPKNITSLFQIKSISKPIGCRAKPADDDAGNLQFNNPRIRCLCELEVRVLPEGRNTSWKVPLRQLKNIFKELNESTQLLAGVWAWKAAKVLRLNSYRTIYPDGLMLSWRNRKLLLACKRHQRSGVSLIRSEQRFRMKEWHFNSFYLFQALDLSCAQHCCLLMGADIQVVVVAVTLDVTSWLHWSWRNFLWDGQTVDDSSTSEDIMGYWGVEGATWGCCLIVNASYEMFLRWINEILNMSLIRKTFQWCASI